MVMDMDLPADSPPISRPVSPPLEHSNGAIKEETEVSEEQATPAYEKVQERVQSPVDEKPKKMGNLMKELKQDVTQGAMEFNMDSFF